MITPRTHEQVIDHILRYDPEDQTTALSASSMQPSFMAPGTLPAIPWPSSSKPIPKPFGKKPDPNGPLPEADILVVTWTVAEALALSDVLTPGYRSKTDWYRYAHNWKKEFMGNIKKGAPALMADRLGLWFRTRIGKKNVVCVKSDLHLARDGGKLPVRDLWRQMIHEVNPDTVVTTGTAGGVGSNIVLGDVVVSKKVRFECHRTFKNAPYAHAEFRAAKNTPVGKIRFANQHLMNVTLSRLPELSRQPKILVRPIDSKSRIDVVTTDFFAFDDSTDRFQLQALGSAVEMGDAVLGLVCSELGARAPAWIAVRNASDPQIDGSLAYARQVEMAGRIYEKYGYWTSVNSAIACWALIAS
jgi:nucleoside phosphorylase